MAKDTKESVFHEVLEEWHEAKYQLIEETSGDIYKDHEKLEKQKAEYIERFNRINK